MADEKAKKETIEDVLKDLKSPGSLKEDSEKFIKRLSAFNAGPSAYAVGSAHAEAKIALDGAESTDDIEEPIKNYNQTVAFQGGMVAQLMNTKYKDLIDSLSVEQRYGFMAGTSGAYAGVITGQKRRRGR
jgi:hypothetical protein